MKGYCLEVQKMCMELQDRYKAVFPDKTRNFSISYTKDGKVIESSETLELKDETIVTVINGDNYTEIIAKEKNGVSIESYRVENIRKSIITRRTISSGQRYISVSKNDKDEDYKLVSTNLECDNITINKEYPMESLCSVLNESKFVRKIG